MRDLNRMWEYTETILSSHRKRNRIILFVLLAFLMTNVSGYFKQGYANALNKSYVVVCQDGLEIQRISVPILGRKVVIFPLHHEGKYQPFSLEIVNGSVRLRENRICKVRTNTNNEWIRRSDEEIRMQHLNVKIYFVR